MTLYPMGKQQHRKAKWLPFQKQKQWASLKKMWWPSNYLKSLSMVYCYGQLQQKSYPFYTHYECPSVSASTHFYHTTTSNFIIRNNISMLWKLYTPYRHAYCPRVGLRSTFYYIHFHWAHQRKQTPSDSVICNKPPTPNEQSDDGIAFLQVLNDC